jgi:hypothetical protein
LPCRITKRYECANLSEHRFGVAAAVDRVPELLERGSRRVEIGFAAQFEADDLFFGRGIALAQRRRAGQALRDRRAPPGQIEKGLAAS